MNKRFFRTHRTALLAIVLAIVSLFSFHGCATPPNAFERALYDAETNFVPRIITHTNVVTVTNVVPEVRTILRTEFVTNAVGTVSTVTNAINEVSFKTNVVSQVSLESATNYTAEIVLKPKAAAETIIGTTGGIVGGFWGMGGLVSTALLGIYHAFAQMRNRKIAGGLAQIIETGREILASTPQGQTAEAKYTEWMVQHQAAAGWINTAAKLASGVDNEAAQSVAKLIVPIPPAQTQTQQAA